MSGYFRPTVVIIDLDAMTHNYNFFRKRISHNADIMAIVKADAYGHGVVQVVKHLKTLGVTDFAVAFLDEALQLRKVGIEDKILVLGFTPETGIEKAAKNDIALTVFTKDMVSKIETIGKRIGQKTAVHLKIDTGMGRIGIFPEDFNNFFQYLKTLNWVKLEGVFTHFATADESDKSFTVNQHKRFLNIVSNLDMNETPPYIHISNSAAMIDLPDLKQQTITRLGISLYGLLPSNQVSISFDQLKPVMSVRTEIIYLKKIKSGQTVSYGATFKAARDTFVATLPIGYADGLSRGLSNKGYVLVQGKKAPIIGRVCMDQTMIDVTDIPETKIGDLVIIIGEQKSNIIRLDDHAEIVGTINYELATLIGKRVPKLYIRGGEIIETYNPLTW